MRIEIIVGLPVAFGLGVVLMPGYIRLLNRFGFGKQIREEGPESHQVKSGTPTMGGFLMILVVLVVFPIIGKLNAATYAPLAALGLVGALGAVDDYLNAKTGTGVNVRGKLVWQTAVAVGAAIQLRETYNFTGFEVPFIGAVNVPPIVWIAIAAFAIVAMSNGVNLTDGLDGLAGGTLVFAYLGYMIIALTNTPNQQQLALLCAIIIGAVLGFLWFNVHPAQIFMGDSGSLALGATLAVTALITGQVAILPLIGIIFVVETLSVVLQVGSFKLRHGKRIFRMSPIHHHFELAGWNEEKVTLRFWIVGALASLLGVTFFMSTVGK